MTLVNKILFGGGAALALFIVVAFVGLLLTNAQLRAQLAETQAAATACRLANDDFSDKVARQNRAIAEWQRAAVAHNKEALAASDVSRKNARAFLRTADKLRKTKAKGDACQSAEALLNAYLKGLR